MVKVYTSMKSLDLGCGSVKVNGAVGLDNANIPGVDIIHDLLDFPYPIENKSYENIYLRHVIEHFYLDDLDKILKECFRILIPGGSLEITVPHAFSVAGVTDPTHKLFFTFSSGYFWDQTYHKSYYNEIDSHWELVSIKCNKIVWFDWKRYQFKRLDSILSSIMKKRINRALKKINNPSLADRILKKYNFQFAEIGWSFRKIK